jgi:putative ABC transport system permease protein
VLGRRPGFTAVVVLTLALGVGATTALFAVVNSVLLRPLPFPAPQQLVSFWGTAPEKGLPVVAYPDGLFHALHERTRTMESMAAYEVGGFNLSGNGEAERLSGAFVSTDFFQVFGVRPLLGRGFLPGDALTDTATTAVLSYSLWKRHFSGDSGIVGRTIRLNDRTRLVVGVMPQGFDFPDRVDVWAALRIDPSRFDCWCLSTVARLKPGVQADEAHRDILRIGEQVVVERRDVFPDSKPGEMRAVLVPLHEQLFGDVRTPLLIVFAAGAFVLLIACANIANLLLARAAAREREIAIRCCLGASRRRVIAQLLTESLVLSVAGAAGGTALTYWVVQLLRQLPPDQIPRLDQLRVDPLVLLFGCAIGVATGLLFGLAPALRASRVQMHHAVKDGARSGSSSGSRRLGDAFVVTQFAFSLILLVGAGLMLRSFRNLLAVNPGYRVENTLTARLSLPNARYTSDSSVQLFYEQLVERIRGIPGVRSAGITSHVPLARFNPQNNVVAEGHEPAPGQPVLVANIRSVTPGYFEAIGTPILRGRGFEVTDRRGAPKVVVIDESFAQRYWPAGDAVGKRIAYGGDTSSTRWMTVVGVAPNVKHNALSETPSLQVYQPFAQATDWQNYLVVRYATGSNSILPMLRAQLASLDPSLPLFEVRTMEEALDQSLATRRLTDRLLSAFALAAVLLAAIGIYGVIALNVGARMHELGVRVALGARAADVVWMILRHGLWLAILGVVVGLGGAVWLTRYLRTLLFGIGRFDAATFVAVSLILGAVGAVACLGPAWRATRADPIGALRSE